MYLPPRGSKYFTTSFAENCILDLYNNFKETVASSQESKFVVMVDFNLPNVNWESNTTAISVDQSLLDSMTQELLLEQIIRSTHKRGNILDLVFVSQPDAFDYEVLPSSFSDHYPLIISYDYLPCYVAPFSSQFSASGFNQNMLESKIDLIDFEAVSSLQNTSEFLLKTLVDVISSCLVRKRKKRKLFPFYYSSLTMHSINKLETAKRQLSSKQKLDKLKKEVMDFVELDKLSFLQSTKTFSTNDAFKMLKSLSGRSSFPNEMIYQDRLAGSDNEKANLFNLFFHSVYKKSSLSLSLSLSL